MKVKELIAELQKHDEDMEVVTNLDAGQNYGKINEIGLIELYFSKIEEFDVQRFDSGYLDDDEEYEKKSAIILRGEEH